MMLSGGGWNDSVGKVWDSTAGAWKDAWSGDDVVLFKNGVFKIISKDNYDELYCDTGYYANRTVNFSNNITITGTDSHSSYQVVFKDKINVTNYNTLAVETVGSIADTTCINLIQSYTSPDTPSVGGLIRVICNKQKNYNPRSIFGQDYTNNIADLQGEYYLDLYIYTVSAKSSTFSKIALLK